MEKREKGKEIRHFQGLGRIAGQTAALFLLCNLVFWLLQPALLQTAGRLSLYNRLFPGRERLPYGESIADTHNLTLNNLPAMMASHAISQPKAAEEFRVVVLGDSATWGWLQRPGETVVAQLNRRALQTADGREVVFYNLGYPVLSLTKDLLLLDEALAFEPDLIVWIVTLESLALDQQAIHPLVQANSSRLTALGVDVELPPDDPPWWSETIIGRRRDLADLLRLQLVGSAWAATGIDQVIPAEFELRANDLKDDQAWHGVTPETGLSTADLALEILQTGAARTAVPLMLINEPIFIADGQNSDIRYNSLYPRWAYDQYRTLLADEAQRLDVEYLDMWDAISPAEFTDSPVHLTPNGADQFAALIAMALEDRTHLSIINYQ